MSLSKQKAALSFTELFPFELAKRNFPHACGRNAIITTMSRYFWKGEHEHAVNVDISDCRLMVKKPINVSV